MATWRISVNHAIREGWLQSNPVTGAVRPQDVDEGGSDLRFLDVEAVHQLARVGPQDDDLGRFVERDLYLVAAMTGMRQGELLGLACAQVDFTAGVIRVVRQVQDGEFGPTKGKKRRIVPMAEPVAQVLARRCADLSPDELVFGDPETGLPVSRHRVGGVRFEAACKRAGVQRVTFHELRHTFGTTVARGGASLVEIMAWMGHEDLATTQKYLHYATRPSEAQLIGRAFARDLPPRLTKSANPDPGSSAGDGQLAARFDAREIRVDRGSAEAHGSAEAEVGEFACPRCVVDPRLPHAQKVRDLARSQDRIERHFHVPPALGAGHWLELELGRSIALPRLL